MTFNYAASAATASRLLAQFGQAVTLSRIVPGTYDPVTGVTAPDTPQTQEATAVLLAASKGTIEAFDVRFDGDTLIESKLRSLIIAAQGLAWPPGPGCKVTANGETWTMIGMTPLAPAGVPVIYRASVQR